MKKKIALLSIVLALVMAITAFAGCTTSSKKEDDNKVLIYCASSDDTMKLLEKEFKAKFPDYDIQVEYMTSGDLAAKMAAEGKNTSCDIVFDLDYGYINKSEPYLHDLSSYDLSKFVEESILPSKKIVPNCRNGGCIAINEKMLKEKGIAVPASYADLIKPEYKGLISMPNPKSSGTGYMFYKSLVNKWGEDEALAYFDALEKNVLHFTSSGSGPVNDIVQGEAAIGFAMTAQTVAEINKGASIKIHFFEEGSPYSFYGAGIIEGKQDKKAVKEVFDFFYDTLIEKNSRLNFPEKIFKDIDIEIENYPEDIKYADMAGNTVEEKERLLEKWKF